MQRSPTFIYSSSFRAASQPSFCCESNGRAGSEPRRPLRRDEYVVVVVLSNYVQLIMYSYQAAFMQQQSWQSSLILVSKERTACYTNFFFFVSMAVYIWLTEYKQYRGLYLLLLLFMRAAVVEGGEESNAVECSVLLVSWPTSK